MPYWAGQERGRGERVFVVATRLEVAFHLRIALSDAFDEGSRSLEAHARRQPRNGFILPVVDRVLLRIAADEWEPDLRPQRIIGLPLGHADHDAVRAADFDAAANDRGVGAEAAFPQRFADDDPAFPVFEVIVLHKKAARERIGAEH